MAPPHDGAMIAPLYLAAAQLPPIVLTSTSPEPALVTWQVQATCEGSPVVSAALVRPLAEYGFFVNRSDAEAPVRLTFSIDASGRALDIAAPRSAYQIAHNDLGPSLAASRFPPVARSGCVATFTPVRARFAEADLTAAIGYTIFPTSGLRPSRALLDRIKPAGSTCFEPVPAVLNRAFPDFKAVPQAPGTLSWSMVGFDIDAGGRPVRVKRVAGTGNGVLDAKAAEAVRASRFEKGARTGCLYPYYRRGEPLPAPAITIAKEWRPTGSTCPADPVTWAKPPVYSYPDNYRRRGVEGWAVVQYDVAPWGEIGNVRVLAAEPAAAFGESAVLTLRGASRPASDGYRGCVDRVRFVMRDRPAHAGTNEVGPPTG